MKKHFRLINITQGGLIGDFKDIKEAWESAKQNKGKMILWYQEELKQGWIWKQQPLKFIPRHKQIIFKAKNIINNLLHKVFDKSIIREVK